jgi:Holliday junction resolvase
MHDLIKKQAPPRGGRRSRDKGGREERNLVNRHLGLGIHAERYPLSGASRFRGSGHDLDIYALGRDTAPLVAECKARKSGGGFVQVEKWLGEFDLLFLRRNSADPLVVLPWRVWAALLAKVRR